MGRKLVFMLIILALGLSAGYFLGKGKQDDAKKVIEFSQDGISGSQVTPADKTEKISLKLDLLKKYTDFVLLPADSIAEPLKIVDEMQLMVSEINDEKIAELFLATGEENNREQNIITFLDYLNENIKADLN